jgi:hypothetical protein
MEVEVVEVARSLSLKEMFNSLEAASVIFIVVPGGFHKRNGLLLVQGQGRDEVGSSNHRNGGVRLLAGVASVQHDVFELAARRADRAVREREVIDSRAQLHREQLLLPLSKPLR